LKWVKERLKNEELAKEKLKEAKERLGALKEHQATVARALQGASIAIPVDSVSIDVMQELKNILDLNGELDELRTAFNFTKSQHKTAQQSIASLEEELSLTIDDRDASYQVSDEQARKLQQYEDLIEKLRASEKVLQDKFSKAEATQNSLKEQLQTSNETNVTLAKANGTLDARVKQFEARNEQLRSSNSRKEDLERSLNLATQKELRNAKRLANAQSDLESSETARQALLKQTDLSNEIQSVACMSADQLRVEFDRLVHFPYLKELLVPLLKEVVVNGIKLEAFIMPELEQHAVVDNEFADWVPQDLLRNPGLISYPPAILSWVRIWAKTTNHDLPDCLQAYDLSSRRGILAAFDDLLQEAAFVEPELILFKCLFINVGTPAVFRWRNIIGWLEANDEFRLVHLDDVRRVGRRIFVEEYEVDPVVGSWYFEKW